MEPIDLDGMVDVTFKKVSHHEFVHTYSGFLVRPEVEGVEVALVQEKNGETGYRVIVLCDSKAIYSEHFGDDYDLAYGAYRQQVSFVRSFFIQNGRKPIFYFQDKDNSIIPVSYS